MFNIDSIIQFYLQYQSFMGPILWGFCIVLVFVGIYFFERKGRKPSTQANVQKLAKTIGAQSAKIAELESRLGHYKRENTGVSAKWAAPREDKSAYLLVVYNDLPERIFNVKIRIEDQYAKYSKILTKKQTCDPQEYATSFFIPGGWEGSKKDIQASRINFIGLWLKNKLKPINFIIEYTEVPVGKPKTIQASFSRDNLTQHFKTSIQTIKSRPKIVRPTE